MSGDVETLTQLNAQIIDAENRGDRAWLAGVLAPRLAFQRADKTIDDQDAFLQKVAGGGARVEQIIEPIQLFGDRAVVQSIVAVGEKRIHNLRLFVRLDGAWKLLGWANELV